MIIFNKCFQLILLRSFTSCLVQPFSQNVVMKTLIVASPFLLHNYRTSRPGQQPNSDSVCFESEHPISYCRHDFSLLLIAGFSSGIRYSSGQKIETMVAGSEQVSWRRTWWFTCTWKLFGGLLLAQHGLFSQQAALARSGLLELFAIQQSDDLHQACGPRVCWL